MWDQNQWGKNHIDWKFQINSKILGSSQKIIFWWFKHGKVLENHQRIIKLSHMRMLAKAGCVLWSQSSTFWDPKPWKYKSISAENFTEILKFWGVPWVRIWARWNDGKCPGMTKNPQFPIHFLYFSCFFTRSEKPTCWIFEVVGGGKIGKLIQKLHEKISPMGFYPKNQRQSRRSEVERRYLQIG